MPFVQAYDICQRVRPDLVRLQGMSIVREEYARLLIQRKDVRDSSP